MSLNKNFLTEVIKYLINRGVTLADVMDTFNEHFNTLDEPNNAIKYEHKNHDEVRKPITDIDLLLCGREIEKQGFNKDVKEHVTVTESVTESPYKLVVTPVSCKTEPKTVSLKDASLSPNFRPYPTSIEPHGKGVSKARKMLFEVVEGKTVLEHLKANNIGYKLFDTRIRKNWTMEKACTTPLTKVIKPYTRAKKPTETPKQEPVIIPDTDVKCLEPEKITGAKVTTAIIDEVIPAENTAEIVTIEPQTETDTDTRENNADAYSDAICEELHETDTDKIERIVDQTVRDIVTGKNKEKKKPENKKDYAVSDLCFKLNITTHELREKIEMGELPQPDRGNKWSAKLLKGKI